MPIQEHRPVGVYTHVGNEGSHSEKPILAHLYLFSKEDRTGRLEAFDVEFVLLFYFAEPDSDHRSYRLTASGVLVMSCGWPRHPSAGNVRHGRGYDGEYGDREPPLVPLRSRAASAGHQEQSE